jgi:choice-of-anchor B domain-containing protein
MRHLFFHFLIVFGLFVHAQVPCVNGKADGYDCFGISLAARVNVLALGAEEHNGIWVNDIWGWTDPLTGKEYALVGMTNGTSFVDVSDPVNPIVLGVLKEHNWDKVKETKNENSRILHEGAKSIWRDIKVYQHYAYVVSEDQDHGIQVFDLTDLRDVTETPVDFQEAGHYDGVGSTHNIFINEETGFLYAVGFNQNDRACSAGGLHIVDLSDPVNPTFAGCYDEDGYTHDTQCVIYSGPDSEHQGKEICFSSNEDTITITDVSDKGAPVLISRNNYTGAFYAHQGWLTEDQRYFLANDELDELNTGNNTKTRIWDMQDLDNPEIIGTFTHSTKAIDHNLYVKGNRAYESNYTSGLRVLNLTGIATGELEEDWFFDTFKSNNSAEFRGTWSNYPFFESGIVVVSDITNGLFVLIPQAIAIKEQPKDITACVGTHLDFPMKVVGDNLSYQWQIDEGNGFENILDFERYMHTTMMSMHAHTLSLAQDGHQFRCIITNGEGAEFISDVMTLTVLEEASAGFEYTIESDFTVTFSNTSTVGTNYSWSFGDGTANSSEVNPTHTYAEEGTYEVALTTSNACSEDVYAQTITLEPLSTIGTPRELRVYPNPATQVIYVESSGSFSAAQASILAIDGRKMRQLIVQPQAPIDIRDLESGFYLLRISNSGEDHVIRFVVDK